MKQQRKKGQLHISETLLVVFFLVMLIIFAVIFYYKFSFQKTTQLGEELSEREATLLLARVLTFEGLSCDHDPCLDTGKFLAFQRLQREDPRRFRALFGEKVIAVSMTYPEPTNISACDVPLYIQVEYPDNCGYWVLYEHNPEGKAGRRLSSTVSLYFPETEEYRIGKLEIEYYGTL